MKKLLYSIIAILSIATFAFGETTVFNVFQGGTGWGNLNSNTVLLGNGTGKIGTTTSGTAGQVLMLSNGVPTWSATTSTFAYPFPSNATSTPLSFATTTLTLNNRLFLSSSMDAQDGENSSLELKYRNDLRTSAKAAISFESSTSTVAWIAAHDYLDANTWHGHLSFETKNASNDELHTRLAIDHNCDAADCEVEVSNADLRITNGSFNIDTTQIFAGQYLDIIPNNLANYGGNTGDYLRIATTSDSGGIALSAFGGTYFQFADDLFLSDNNVIGLSTTGGHIEFDDQATDEINFLNAIVGVGISTPDGELNINPYTSAGVLSEDATDYGLVFNLTTGSATGDIERNIAFRDSGGNAVAAINAKDNGTGGATSLGFFTGNTTLLSEKLSILNTGNVGIGTTSPGNLLEVSGAAGQLGLFGNGNSNYYIGFGGSLASGNNNGRAYFGLDGNGPLIQGALGKGISFAVNNSTFGSGVVGKFDTSGRLGIGTTSPYAKLSVDSGSATGDILATATSTGKRIWGVGSNGHIWSGGPSPTASSCGTAPVVVGNDQAGTIYTYTAITLCTLDFVQTYTNVTCNVSANANVGVYISATTTSSITFGFNSSNPKLTYQCQDVYK